MQILSDSLILIKKSDDDNIKDFLENSLIHFYEELDFFCDRNKNTNFGQWFSESGFLSMYINGVIRHDSKREVSAVQEYCVSNVISGGSGRCDGFIERNNSVFLLEAKRQQYSRPVGTDHFKIDKWLAWDKEQIQVQLKKYLKSEGEFFLQEGRYQSIYLMTIVFKAIRENKDTHLGKATQNLDVNEKKSDRIWYYSTAFINQDSTGTQDGIEVYGTIQKYVPAAVGVPPTANVI